MAIGIALALLLSVNTALEAQEIWVLLHGIGGSGRDWRYVAPELARSGQTVLRPSLSNYTGLFAWAENVVEFFEKSRLLERADRSVLVVAHSFGGAVVLFLLKTAYALEHHRLAHVEAQLDCARLRGRAVGACHQIKAGWQALLSNPQRAQKWVRAAQKVKHVFLYHAALRGACGAEFDLLGLWGDASASLQLLAQLGDSFYLPLEHLSWGGQIALTNLYGGRKYMLSLCGLAGNDSLLSYDQQRLSREGPGYREILFDHRSHFAFALSSAAGRQLAKALDELARTLSGGVP